MSVYCGIGVSVSSVPSVDATGLPGVVRHERNGLRLVEVNAGGHREEVR